jgi:phosphoribosylanthranilate isomerase
MKVKICGMRRKEDILYANILKPDYIGFIFAEGFKRQISYDLAYELKNMLDKDIKAVGVYINQPMEYIIEAVDKKIIDMIQLHGNESDEYIKELKETVDVPIINVYRISEYADYVLYDGKNPGSGEVFDYKDIDIKKPFFIAGGINIDNVFEFKKLSAYCIDTSSGVEVDGFKDFSKMEEFIRRVSL